MCCVLCVFFMFACVRALPAGAVDADATIIRRFLLAFFFFFVHRLLVWMTTADEYIAFYIYLYFAVGATVASGTIWYDLVIGVCLRFLDKYFVRKWGLLCEWMEWTQQPANVLRDWLNLNRERAISFMLANTHCVCLRKTSKITFTILSMTLNAFDYGNRLRGNSALTNRLSSNICDLFLVFPLLY